MEKKFQKNKPERRLAIGDIHGCYKTFIQLVEQKIGFTKNDALYLLGDYIDRGKNSKLVLDWIINMRSSGYTIYALRGNHEQDLLDLINKYTSRELFWYLRKMKSEDLIENQQIAPKYTSLMQQMPYYIELQDYYLVHGGMDFSKPAPLKNTNALLNLRNTVPDEEFLQGKRIIHGHQPTYIDAIKKRVAQRATIIPLDNGAVVTKKHKVYDYTKLGNLCAFNLDSNELIIQKNIEDKSG